MKKVPLVAAFVLASCTNGDSPTGTGSLTNVIVPLKLGNSWMYSATSYDENGVGYAWLPYTLELLQDTILNNETCYFIGGERTLVVNRYDGLWGFDLGTIPQYLVLKYPSSEGYTYSTGSEREYTITVHNRDTSVAVASGRYSCYLYLARHVSGSEIQAFVAPNTGIVMAEFFEKKQFGGTYLSLRMVLTDLHLQE